MLNKAQLEEATQPSSPGLGLMPATLAAQCWAASKSLVIKWGSVYHHGERDHFSQSLSRSTSLVGIYPKEPGHVRPTRWGCFPTSSSTSQSL